MASISDVRDDQESATRNTNARVTDLVLIAVVVASLLGRYSFTIARFSVRPEQLMTVVLALWVLSQAQSRRALVRQVTDPLILLLIAWLAVGAISTALYAPARSSSLPILLWLVSDVILFASLRAVSDRLRTPERAGAYLVLPLALAGVVVVALAARGTATWGAQFDNVFGVYAAFVTTYEANIFAAFVAAWALVLVWREGRRWWLAALTAVIVPLGILSGQTRAALAALVVALLTMLAMTWRAWWRSPQWWALTRGPLLMLLGLMIIAMPGPLRTFGEVPASAAPPGASSAPGTSPSPPTTPSGGSGTEQSDKLTHFGLGDNFAYRKLVAETALKDLSGTRWIIGSGINTFGQRHDDPTQPGVPGYISSLPVQVLYDTGIVGVGLLVAFLVLTYRRIPPHRRSLAVPVAVAIGITATFTSTLWFTTTWLMLALFLRPTTNGFGGVPAHR